MPLPAHEQGVPVVESMLRVLGEIGPGAAWFVAAVVAVFVIYIGIALVATLRAGDEPSRKIRYQLFHDLLDLFRHGNRR